MRFSVIQLGARMHYAVPRIFHAAGLLERLFTDLVANQGWPRLFNLVPAPFRAPALRRLMARVPAGIPLEKIHSFPWLGLRYALARKRARKPADQAHAHFTAADAMSVQVLRRGLGEVTHIYSFDTASLEVMRTAAQRGIKCVMEQTNAPRLVMTELLNQERTRHPGWEREIGDEVLDDWIMERYREAWRLADLIVCGSEFVREGIERCGGPAQKCVVVPYGVDFNDPVLNDPAWRRETIERRLARRQQREPLHVLSVGLVGLRKGAPYVLAAARALGPRARFRMVGGLDVSPQAVAELRAHVELAGLVPRSEIRQHYQWADVFLLPSVCEGSATVVYEALAHGLPVICTPNTGSVVRNGVDGFIVPPSSAEAVIAALERFLASPELLADMSAAAFATSDLYDLQHYGERLLRAVGAGENSEKLKG